MIFQKVSCLRQECLCHPEHALDVDAEAPVPVVIATVKDGAMMNISEIVIVRYVIFDFKGLQLPITLTVSEVRFEPMTRFYNVN